MQPRVTATKIIQMPQTSWGDVWAAMIGGTLTPQAIALLRWWEDALDADAVQYAIDETALAARPSIRYTIAILRRIAHERSNL